MRTTKLYGNDANRLVMANTYFATSKEEANLIANK